MGAPNIGSRMGRGRGNASPLYAGSVPTLRGHTPSGAITGTSVTLAIPAGSQPGDLAVCSNVGGNGVGMPSGWSTLINVDDYWGSRIFTKTLTTTDIATGSFVITIGGSFINYALLSVFAAGTTIASFGKYHPGFDWTSNAVSSNPFCGAQVGKVDYNPNMYWIICTSCRGANATQWWSANVSSWGIIGQVNNGNGCVGWFWGYFSGLPMWTANHGATPQMSGNFGIGFLGPSPA